MVGGCDFDQVDIALDGVSRFRQPAIEDSSVRIGKRAVGGQAWGDDGGLSADAPQLVVDVGARRVRVPFPLQAIGSIYMDPIVALHVSLDVGCVQFRSALCHGRDLDHARERVRFRLHLHDPLADPSPTYQGCGHVSRMVSESPKGCESPKEHHWARHGGAPRYAQTRTASKAGVLP